ncbi:MAG TPA: CRISPR-associated helicase Cas3' [Polyangiaceae bacterium]|nr:CRISPR-associated helicase Cas3' [Polyangiaceae bacterium]
MRFEEFFESATGRAPYSYQRTFATSESLPDLLEAPTGSGKTATAVLGWMWRRLHGSESQRAEAGSRLIFCLPMRTLVEQTERVVLGYREKLGLSETLGVHVLLGGAVDDRWEGFPDENAILIGTQDQLVSRALMRGYGMSRYLWPVHFALLNSDCTWVMDEVQLMGVAASTAAQLQAFREGWSVAGHCKTVWMTATLSEERLRTVDNVRPFTRQPFEAKEPALLKRLGARKALSSASLKVAKKTSLQALAREIAAAHEAGSLTLVVVNRVARAQELRALLAKEKGIESVALVHSRFRPAERRRIQEAALNGSFHGVLVATQAIEAGVDISAKTLFTELAPWASLVQRFGRLNRAGEHAEAKAVWIDLDTTDPEVALPYETDELDAARLKLQSLTDVGPASLAAVPKAPEPVALPVLRKRDLLELFDTEPDLAGRDIDVSRYIRATDDRDVQVAWRELGKEPPGEDAPDLHRDELCSIPIWAFKRLAKDQSVWRFESLHGRWVKTEESRLAPGMTLLVDVNVGGYDSELGFTGEKRDVPKALRLAARPPDDDESDRLTYGSSDYVTLRMHSEDTAAEMQRLMDRLAPLLRGSVQTEELIRAARFHDLGKVHSDFQRMLLAALSDDDPRRNGGPWAKSDGQSRTRNPRRFFRHELASALTWLAEGGSSLGAFLIAAHHGKVRLSLRARPGEEPPSDVSGPVRFAHGVCDGDLLPQTDLGDGVIVPPQKLSLACMELGGGGEGPSWADRMQQLLSELGPFRLAYLEMLIRIADWRASQKRAQGVNLDV